MGKRIPNIVVREVEVATRAERQFPIAGIVELPSILVVTVAIIGETRYCSAARRRCA